MVESFYRLDRSECSDELRRRILEPAPGRIQLISGPRQVGKTTMLLELAEELGERAVYVSGDEPGASTPGVWDRTFAEAEAIAGSRGSAVLFLDEVTSMDGWARRLKGSWDRIRRRKTPLHVVATGSSSLVLGRGAEESLAGRFERLVLTHWAPASLARTFRMSAARACDTALRWGTYPGSIEYLNDPTRWAAYVREAVIEPALSRDIHDLGPVRKPALLRQVFWVAASSPAQVVALKKLQGQLEDAGSMETIASYLDLLERAYLVAHLDKFSTRAARRRSAPPKLVTLNQALLAVADPAGPPTAADPERLGRWIENAVLAHAWNRGQRVRYWREEPHEVDMVLDGSWGSWAVEVKSGRYAQSDLAGLFEFTRRHPRYQPLFIGVAGGLGLAERLGLAAVTWQDFLLHGPGGKPNEADVVREVAPVYRARKKKTVSAVRTRRSRRSR
ncbi:MAG: ATP-binding protein [Planctomycetota bacterium]|nr:ATP-binding protein [Planctomycetota bacterium]